MPGPYRAAAQKHCSRKPHSVSISPSVGRGAPTPPRPSAAAHSRANRRGRRPRRPAEACAAANLRGGVKTPPYKQTRKPPPTQTPGPGMPGPYRTAARERLPVSTLQCFHIPIRRAGCPHPAATFRRRQHSGRDYSPCLPPWGKVAPQGRMRGRLPLPPIPRQAVGGGVLDAPRRLALAPFPGLPPAETPAAANTRGGVKTPPYRPNH